MLQVFAFYLFSAVLVLSSLGVISARNPVHSVLFLILTFFNASGLFILLGAEFVAMILVIVYVGAVAVLFLFVVMMLDINFAELRAGMMRYMPLGVLTGGILLAELVTLAKAWKVTPAQVGESNPTNTVAIGMQLYTDYVYPFQIAGLILLVAMIGAIVLTHRRRSDVRRQKIADQNARRPQDVVEVVKVSSGAGAA
jgi:NADH-quinone oxidoreductase subunit J